MTKATLQRFVLWVTASTPHKEATLKNYQAASNTIAAAIKTYRGVTLFYAQQLELKYTYIETLRAEFEYQTLSNNWSPGEAGGIYKKMVTQADEMETINAKIKKIMVSANNLYDELVLMREDLTNVMDVYPLTSNGQTYWNGVVTAQTNSLAQ